MASFSAELEVDGQTIRIRRLFLSATRKRDANGRPASATNWQLMISVDTAEDNAFTQWMVDPKMQKDVTVKFYKIDEESVLKQWDLKKAYCFSMRESFAGDAAYLSTTLLVAGQEISNGNATLKFNWN